MTSAVFALEDGDEETADETEDEDRGASSAHRLPRRKDVALKSEVAVIGYLANLTLP